MSITQSNSEVSRRERTAADAVVRQLGTVARITLVVVFDALLFAVWIIITWVAQLTAGFLQSEGLAPFFGTAFLWTSSVGTLLLTIIYVATDIVQAVRGLGAHSSVAPEEVQAHNEHYFTQIRAVGDLLRHAEKEDDVP